MKISILCTDKYHPIYPLLEKLVSGYGEIHDIKLVQQKCELPGGDVLLNIKTTS